MGKKDFVKKFIKLIAKEVGCDIQYGGCPCNTCFYDWAKNDLKLSPDASHLFWFVVLALRGDYSKKEINEGIKEFIELKTRNFKIAKVAKKVKKLKK